MKKIKFVLLFAVALSVSSILFGQNSGRNFGEILQSYYLYKDKDIVDKTVDFVNKTNMDYNSLNPILTGFLGALFLNYATVKADFVSNLYKVAKTDIRELLNRLNRQILTQFI